MLNRDKFSSLLDSLTSLFSKPELHEDKPHIFSLTTLFSEEKEPCFKIICSPITATNLEICEFVMHSIMHVTQEIYKEGMRAEDRYIVSTSGFSDACDAIIQRYKKELDEKHLIMKLENC
jgi:hypothetical protein